MNRKYEIALKILQWFTKNTDRLEQYLWFKATNATYDSKGRLTWTGRVDTAFADLMRARK